MAKVNRLKIPVRRTEYPLKDIRLFGYSVFVFTGVLFTITYFFFGVLLADASTGYDLTEITIKNPSFVVTPEKKDTEKTAVELIYDKSVLSEQLKTAEANASKYASLYDSCKNK